MELTTNLNGNILILVVGLVIKMKENLDHLPKNCQAELDDEDGICGRDITNIHRMYRSLGFCEEHWCENADALWEEFCMTREACR